MKKTYALHTEGKHPDRILDAVKHDIRKYFKRERARPVPAGADFWDFDCRVGATGSDAPVVRVGAVIEAVDALARAGAAAVYVEILTRPGHRVAAAPRSAQAPADASSEASAAPDTTGDPH